MTEDASRAAWLQQARSYLSNADPVLARLIDDRPAFHPGRGWLSRHRRLCTVPCCSRSPVSSFQSRRPAGSLPHRGAFRRPSPLTRPTVGIDPVRLREAGLSWRKINTLRDLAERMSDGRLNPSILSSLPDDEVMAELTAIPGIGPWTVQGALIIALQREDVVLPGDLALRKAVKAAYQLDHLPSQEEVLAIAEKWRPYRSLATSYLFSAAFERTESPPDRPTRDIARYRSPPWPPLRRPTRGRVASSAASVAVTPVAELLDESWVGWRPIELGSSLGRDGALIEQ